MKKLFIIYLLIFITSNIAFSQNRKVKNKENYPDIANKLFYQKMLEVGILEKGADNTKDFNDLLKHFSNKNFLNYTDNSHSVTNHSPENLELTNGRFQFFEDFVVRPYGFGLFNFSAPHGVVVTPDGKIWVGYYGITDSLVLPDTVLHTKPLWIYNPDGTLHHKIQFLTYNGNTDTLINSCRGLSLDINGNVLYTNWYTMRRINYQTYEEINRLEDPFGGEASLTEMACDNNGLIYVHRVVGGGTPLNIYDSNFNYFGSVIDSSFSISRSVVVSHDGKDVYLGRIYGGSQNNGIIHFHSNTGPYGAYAVVDTMHKEIWAGSSLDLDNNGLLWAGSYWDVGPGDRKGWYALDPNQGWTIVDSVGQNVGQNPDTGPQPQAGSYYSPRGAAWSSDGKWMYTADFEGSVIKKWYYTDSPIATTGVASNITVTSARLWGLVNANGLSTTVEFEYGTTASYGNTITAVQSPATGIYDITVSADLSGLSDNTIYHYRIVATNSVDTTNGADEIFTTFLYPQTIDLASPPILFPTHNDISNYVPQDYRIVGIPGRIDTDMNLNAVLSGVHEKDWQAYMDNGANSGDPDIYLDEFDDSGLFHFGNGRAFWIINKGNLQIDEQGVTTVNLNMNEEAEIQLHAGWNLITNPFDRAIEWWQVQQSNTAIGPIYKYDGTDNWPNSDNQFNLFEPYIGYYVDSPTGMILKIPYGATLGKPLFLKKHIWQMDIVLSMNKIEKSSIKLGVSEQADSDRDYLDYRKPRAVGIIPSVYFFRPEWDGGYGIFATDIRPEIQDIEKWDFSVTSPLHQKSTLKFSEIEDVPEQHEIFLLDEFRSVFVNLRDKSEYSFMPVTEISNFSVLVGSKETVLKELEKVIPTEFELGKNFPNPFNPATVIPVSIPEQSDISLKVYDILGKEIKTIFKGAKQTGKYYFSWDGTNAKKQQVAAGVYLYRLIVNEKNMFIGKMVLVK
jgi:sugar lactone lactonase YvrE